MKKLLAVIFFISLVSFSVTDTKIDLSKRMLSANNLFGENTNSHPYSLADSSEEEDTLDSPESPLMPLKDASNMFNERGFYKSNGFSFNEQEIINDFNGNLMYSIPLYNYKLPGDLTFEVSLTYNGSVGHVFHTGDTSTVVSQPWKYNMNFPEWIISIDGIGVQTFNFETNFFTNSVNHTTHIIQGDDVHALIPGYHYSNMLTEASIPNPDQIQILAGDGSVITLINDSHSSDRTGSYSYEGKELFYKARVTYIDAGTNIYRDRRVELMKGDGLIFVFEESSAEFADISPNVGSALPYSKRPKSLLLKKIKDRYSNTVGISYTSEHPYQQISLSGRKLLSGISFNLGFSTNPTNSLGFIYGIKKMKIDHTSKLNGSYTFTYVDPVSYSPYEASTNHRGQVSEIKNVLQQTNTMKYKKFVRNFFDVDDPKSDTNIRVSFNNLNRLINFRNTLGERRGYSYLAADSIGVTLVDYYNIQKLIRSSGYKGYGRDPFFVNMTESKVDSNEIGVPNSSTSFSYDYNNNGGNDFEKPVDTNHVYITIRTTTNNIPGTGWDITESQRKQSYYKVFPLFDPNHLPTELKDVSGLTKLVKEDVKSNSENRYMVISYKYDKGVLTDSIGFNGSFLILEKVDSCLGKVKKNTFQYEYYTNQIGDFGSTPSDLPYEIKEYDALGNYTKTNTSFQLFEYKFFGLLFRDSGVYYKIQVADSIMKYSSSNSLIYKERLSYITDSDTAFGYRGQLLSQKIYDMNNTNNFLQTSYTYYRRDTTGLSLYRNIDNLPQKEGNIKQIISPDSLIQKFYYNLVNASESDSSITDFPNYPPFYYHILYEDGSIRDTFELIYDRRLPIRIDNYKVKNGVKDTLSVVYKTYTEDGSPSKIIDQNRYVTEFIYEPMHRINSITFPGDFSTEKDSTMYLIHLDSLPVQNEIRSDAWGNLDYSTMEADYLPYNDPSLFSCANFEMDINTFWNTNRYAYFTLQNFLVRRFWSLDSAILSLYSRSFIPNYYNNILPQNDFKTYIHPITDFSDAVFAQGCDGWKTRTVAFNNFQDTILIKHQTNCSFELCKADIKNLFLNMGQQGKVVRGLALNSMFTGDPHDYSESPDSIEASSNSLSFNLQLAHCGNNPPDTWYADKSPRIRIYGNLNISDTLKIPIIKGGTIKYKYNDTNHTVNVFNIRDAISNAYSRTKYLIDGLGNIKQQNIYTGFADSNTFKYKFNYFNKPSVSFDALSDSTNFSYDGLQRLIKTRNADSSSTTVGYAYFDSLVYYFGTVKNTIEKQTYTDEEGNNFEKYFDAVGNLRREIKFVEIGSPTTPTVKSLITDYKYDSLYRVVQVRTPGHKMIYYTYDGYGRQLTRVTPDAGLSSYRYDKNNNLIYSQDANQTAVNQSLFTFRNYDGLNRLTGIGEFSFVIDAPSDGSQYVPTAATDYYTINAYDNISNSIVDIFDGVNNDTGVSYTKGRLVATAYRTRLTDHWNFKYYKYDVRGRVIKLWNIIYGFDTLETNYSYNSQDQMVTYSHQAPSGLKKFKNLYDYPGRLNHVKYLTEFGITEEFDEYTNFITYEYNENSQVEWQRYLGNEFNSSFSYNKRNWISEMDDDKSVFSYKNTYYRNGNVKNQIINGSYNDNFYNSGGMDFDYSYDRSNRLISCESVNSFEGQFDLSNTYDDDGNLLTLERRNAGGVIDTFTYKYQDSTNNKLKRVTGSQTQFRYDYNGNMIKDSLNWNNVIKYDYRNLIIQLEHRTFEDNVLIPDTSVYMTYYYYDEAGNRIRKKVYKSISLTLPPDSSSLANIGEDSIEVLTTSWEIYNDEIYSRGIDGKELCVIRNGEVLQWNVWGGDNVGYLDYEGTPFPYLKDHLGSVRATLDKNENIFSAQDYDAWGYQIPNREYNRDASLYQFTSKERDKENKYDYFGARYYDARVGRWGQVEPLLDKYISVSPYCYGLNSPMVLLDIDGLDLTIGGDMDAALNDLRSLFSSSGIQDRITADMSTGKVSFDVSGLDLGSDAALELVNNLVTSEKSYLFEVANKTTAIARLDRGDFSQGDEIKYELTEVHGFLNFSVTAMDASGTVGYLPKGGYSGQVTLGTGFWNIPVPGSKVKDDRWNTVFHELMENYYRTEKGMLYQNSEKDKRGAHQSAQEMASKFKRNTSIRPGWVGNYNLIP